MADSKPQGSGPPQNRGKKRFKSYYVRSKEGKRIRKDTMLTVGMRGILLTCNHGVNPCVKEAYNLLSEYAEKLYGPEKEEGDEKAQGTEEAEEEEDDSEEDLEASLKKEIDVLKKKRKNKQQRFQAIESGAKNVAFIKSTIDDPCHLVHHILTDIQQTKTSKSRHIMRMLPIQATYRSYIEDIEKQAEKILKPHFELLDGDKPISFSIVFKVRNCGHLKRNDTITALHRVVTDMGNHKVDLTNPDKVILVEGVRNVCCMSVLTDFYKLRKYNLQTIMERDTNGEAARYEAKRRPQQSKGPDADTDKAVVATPMEDSDGKTVDAVEEKQPENSMTESDAKTNESPGQTVDKTENPLSEDKMEQNQDATSEENTDTTEAKPSVETVNQTEDQISESGDDKQGQ